MYIYIWYVYTFKSLLKFHEISKIPFFPRHFPCDPRDAVQFRRMIQRDDVIGADPEAAPRDVHLFFARPVRPVMGA